MLHPETVWKSNIIVMPTSLPNSVTLVHLQGDCCTIVRYLLDANQVFKCDARYDIWQ